MPSFYDSPQPSRLNQPMASAASSTDPWSQGNSAYTGGGSQLLGSDAMQGYAAGLAQLGQGLSSYMALQQQQQLLNNMFGQPLPFGEDAKQGVRDVTGLVNEYKSAVAPAMSLTLARNNARQAAASRGLEGPLAASVEVQAQTDAQNLFDQWRRAKLLEAIQVRDQLIQRQQGQFSEYADRRAKMLAAQLAAGQQSGGAIGGGIGMTLGTILGALTGTGPIAGAAGQAAGQAIGSDVGGSSAYTGSRNGQTGADFYNW